MAHGRSVIGILLVAACTSTEGDVLTSIDRDAAVGRDGAPGADADPASCAQDGPCPVPGAGDLTVCGRVIDLEDSSAVSDPDLRVNLFDLIDITTDPPGADPVATVTPDACGWFVAQGIDGLLPGVVAVSTDDALDAGDDYERVVSLVQATTGQAVRTNAYALRGDTDAAWSASAGITGTFGGRGALLAIYIDITEPAVGPFQGAPVAGVTVDGPGTPQTFYFTDTDPLSRATVTSGRATTGPNGAALLLDAELSTSYSGTKAGCSFGSTVGITVPNVVQAQEVIGACN